MEDEFGFDNFDDEENILLDTDFLERPIDVGIDMDEEGEVQQQLETTFEQDLQQRIDIGTLDPYNPKDKPLIQIGTELDFIGLSRDYIQDFLLVLRAKQEQGKLDVLQFLNARYVANAKVYLDETDGKVDEASLTDYVNRRNMEYEKTREGEADNFPYLDKIDFYRYIKIDQTILN